MTFMVHIRNTFLKAGTEGAETLLKFRHAQQGEPALNKRMHMTAMECAEFKRMLAANETESKDIVAGRITTYTITKD